MAGLPNGNGSGATTSIAIVAARAERLSRIAALARNDLQYASDGGGDGFPAPVLEAPWMQRRLQRNIREQQQRQQRQQDQVVALAVGMGQQFGAMQRQLEEQSRQLKDLAVGHCAQTSLQQQLLKLLDKIEDASKQVCRPRVEQENTNLPYGSHTPEEYHTIAWLNSHRQAGKQDRIKHPLPHGFKPIRKSGTHIDNRSSASDRTRTTVGAIDRICRATSQRSTPRADTDRSVGSASKRNTEPHGVSNLSTDDKMFENTNKRRLPLVAALYAKCKHKTHKKNSTREKVLKSIREFPNQAENRVALSRLEAENQSHSYGVEPVEKKAMDSELDDTILDSMLSLHKYEDELKLRWLVPDAAEHGKTTGSCWHSITDEIANLEDGKTSRYGEGLNEQHLGDNWLIKEQARRNSRRNYTNEWLTDTLMDEVLKEIAGELCSLCDNFVEHIYYSEFLNQEP